MLSVLVRPLYIAATVSWSEQACHTRRHVSAGQYASHLYGFPFVQCVHHVDRAESVPNPRKDTTPFICNCTDCRKVTASMFATNFPLQNKHITSVRNESFLTSYLKDKGIDSGNTMTSCFCSKCGTLMYRISSGLPDWKILRVGTVDDFQLHETLLKPRIEQFVKDRVSWFTGGVGVKQFEGNFLNKSKSKI